LLVAVFIQALLICESIALFYLPELLSPANPACCW